ncbi:hypothetical protein OE88DRAFT_263559 [Heliocybe sulcata]|uniref:Chromo domain-containing protein n=1 Tax=Heliocybe sulcata TaxID=5364 RepID=A0A5C3N0E0_9AGAM|nr:hypothetical protein OE88DRAFT_263559 [Heliocybe sulcata]
MYQKNTQTASATTRFCGASDKHEQTDVLNLQFAITCLAKGTRRLCSLLGTRTTMSDNEAGPSTQISDFETQFVPQENDDEELWEVIEITGEQGNRYCVKWAGLDPATGKPWAQSWVPKHDCTDDLVEEWKRKKARKKRQQEVVKDKARTATARASTSTKSSNRRSTSSTTVKRTTRSSRSLPAEGDTLAHPNKRSRPSPGKRTSKSRTHEDDSEEFEPAPPRKRQRLWEVPDSDSEEEEDGSTKKNRVNGKMKEEFVEQETWNTDYSNEPGREPSPPSLNKANKGKQKASRVSVEIPAVSKVMASKVPSNPVVEDAGSETESDDDLIPRPQKAKRTLPFSSTVRDRISAPVPAPPSARAGKGKGKLTDIDRIALREEEEEESQVISQVVLSERTPTPPSPLRRLPAQDGDVDLQTNDDYLDYHFDGEEPMYSPPSTDRRPKLLVKSRHDDSSVLVPETQPTPPSNRLRTPPRRSGASASFRTPLTSRSQAIRVYDHSSPQVSPRSSKKTPSNRPLKPIPAMTPSNFRQFQPTQGEEGEDESIYQFSSPEKGRSREAISSQRTQDMLKEMLKRKSTSSLPSRDTVSGRMKPRKRLSDIIANKSAVQVAPVHEDGVDQQTTFEEMENAYVDYSSGVLAEADSNSLPKQFDASLPEPEKSAPVADGKTLANGVHLRRDNAEEVPASLSAEQASSIVHSQSQDEDLRQQLDSAVELLNKKSQEIARLETELQTAKRDAELVRKDESRKFDEAKRQLTLAHTELLETWRSQTDQKEKAASEQLQALQHDLEEWKRRGNENAEKEAKWAESKRDLENQRDLFHEQHGSGCSNRSSRRG